MKKLLNKNLRLAKKIYGKGATVSITFGAKYSYIVLVHDGNGKKAHGIYGEFPREALRFMLIELAQHKLEIKNAGL